jgi:hypothetical protein
MEEHVHVGDEHGVQSRFDDRIVQTLSLIARHQGRMAPRVSLEDWNKISNAEKRERIHP